MFPTGELHISKVDHKDGTKEYRCQTRFKLISASTSDSGPGRLMVQGEGINPFYFHEY